MTMIEPHRHVLALPTHPAHARAQFGGAEHAVWAAALLRPRTPLALSAETGLALPEVLYALAVLDKRGLLDVAPPATADHLKGAVLMPSVALAVLGTDCDVATLLSRVAGHARPHPDAGLAGRSGPALHAEALLGRVALTLYGLPGGPKPGAQLPPGACGALLLTHSLQPREIEELAAAAAEAGWAAVRAASPDVPAPVRARPMLRHRLTETPSAQRLVRTTLRDLLEAGPEPQRTARDDTKAAATTAGEAA